MGIVKNHKKGEWNTFSDFDYVCNGYRNNGAETCTRHRINGKTLYSHVLARVQKIVAEAQEDDNSATDADDAAALLYIVK